MVNRDLRCFESRDKAYGLFGVVRMDTKESIKADYSLPLHRLLHTVLRLHHREQPPTSIETVANDCNQLTELFGLDGARMFDLEDDQGIVPLPKVKKWKQCPLRDRNVSGITLWWAVFYGHEAVERLFTGNQHRCDVAISSWFWAIWESEVSLLRFLLRSDSIDIRATPVLGNATSALHTLEEACRLGQLEVVNLMIDEMTKLRLDGVDLRIGRKPLHVSASAMFHDAVDSLLHMKVDANATARDTALFTAKYKGFLGVVQVLLDNGINVNGCFEKPYSKQRGTALQAACHTGNIAVVKLLLENGANVHTDVEFALDSHESCSANAPLEIAMENGHTEVVRMLVAAGAGTDNAREVDNKSAQTSSCMNTPRRYLLFASRKR
ncbi:hypothetical protein LTR10_010444 [Elasticomyces elasticus]|nr:hypothetical protein LTR10_010444 [Elasticomyces elasticus]KAK4972343.1 hypothetical protein LTR42_006852 [Elasticomyces elasticus]